MSTKSLLLIDGAAVAYRAFYAIHHLSTRAGQPTNALFGFIRMIRQLEARWHPTHWAVVFDAGLPATRMNLLPTYKQQREKMPDELRCQFPLMEEFLRHARITAIRVEGQEADDTMASLALLARNEQAETLLATNDKDMFQIVSGQVAIVAPTAAGGRMGPAEVRAKTGVPPEQIVELLALTGDTADNIPGVPGIGLKTAAKLLEEFGTLEGLWSHLGAVAGEKIRTMLLAHRSDVERNVQLIRLRADLVKQMDWDALRVQASDTEALMAFLQKVEFHSMAHELAGAQPARPEAPQPPTAQMELF